MAAKKTATTSSNRFVTDVADLEIDQSAITAAADRLRAAEEDAARCEQQHEDAARDLRDTRAAISAGSLPADGDDLHRAISREEGTALALEGAQGRLARERNQRTVTSLEPIKAAAPAFQTLTRDGVTVLFGIGDAPTCIPEGASEPTLVVTMSHGHRWAADQHGRARRNGALAYSLTGTYFRSRIHREIDVARLEDSFYRHCDTSKAALNISSGEDRDIVRMDLEITPQIPRLPHTPQVGGSALEAQAWLSILIDQVTRGHRWGQVFSVTSGVHEDAVSIMRDGGSATIASVEEKDGRQMTTIVARYTIVAAEGGILSLIGELEDAAATLEGRSSDAGRVTSAKLSAEIDHEPGTSAKVTLTAVCEAAL